MQCVQISYLWKQNTKEHFIWGGIQNLRAVELRETEANDPFWVGIAGQLLLGSFSITMCILVIIPYFQDLFCLFVFFREGRKKKKTGQFHSLYSKSWKPGTVTLRGIRTTPSLLTVTMSRFACATI